MIYAFDERRDTLLTRSRTLGLDLNFVGGPFPLVGLETGIGIQLTSVQAPHYGPDPKTLTFLPLTFGLTSSPRVFSGRSAEMRLDVGRPEADVVDKRDALAKSGVFGQHSGADPAGPAVAGH